MDRRTITIGLAGLSRAAAGGMLATALAVYVGRAGSAFAVGMLAAVFFGATMIFTPLWGAVGDATGRRRPLLLVIATGTAVLALSFALAQSVWQLIGLRGVYAVVVVGFAPLLLSLVRTLAGPARRGRSSGFLASAMAAGDVVAQIAVGILLGVLAPSKLYAVVAGISLLSLAAVAALQDPTEPATGPRALSPRDTLGAIRDRLLPGPVERRVLRETGLGWLYGALALRHAAVKGVGSLVPLFLLTRLQTGEAAMGLLLTVAPAAQVGLMPVTGRLADQADRAKPLLLVGLLSSAMYGPLLAAAGTVDGGGRILVTVVAFLAIGVGFSAMDMATVAFIGSHAPADRETSLLGLRSTAAGIGGVFGPVLIGSLVVGYGYGVGFGVAGGLAVAAGGIVAATLAEPPGDRTGPDSARAVETTLGLHRPYRGGEAD